LQGYDYSREGAYFITLCVHNRECMLGAISDGQEMELIRAYIHHNPLQWATDKENPDTNATL